MALWEQQGAAAAAKGQRGVEQASRKMNDVAKLFLTSLVEEDEVASLLRLFDCLSAWAWATPRWAGAGLRGGGAWLRAGA
jgi:hypothetical protein